MIAPKLEAIVVKSHSKLRRSAIELSQPLLDAQSLMAESIRTRIIKTGKGASGPFSEYSSKSNKKGPKNFFRSGTWWSSLQVRLQTPTKATAKFYGKANDGFSRRRNRATGANELRRNKRGRYIQLSNSELGRILQSKERQDIMEPNNEEIRDLETLLDASFTEQCAELLEIEETIFQTQKNLRSRQRRAKTARRKLTKKR